MRLTKALLILLTGYELLLVGCRAAPQDLIFSTSFELAEEKNPQRSHQQLPRSLEASADFAFLG